MDMKQLESVLARLDELRSPASLVPFRYQKEDYARWLLAWALDRPRAVRELKRGPVAQLMSKPGPRACLSGSGGGRLDALDLLAGCGGNEPYWLSASQWGHPDNDHDDQQTVRKGYNLVLQVNFPHSHEQAYRRLLDPSGVRPFTNEDHPVRRSAPDTMAWARIDLDLLRGEALIEEIQSDWLREAVDLLELADRAEAGGNDRLDYCDLNMGVSAIREYAGYVLRPHAQLWSELTLLATLWLLWERLGISKVWYFSHSGSWLKGESCEPPRSVYEKLPRRFGFRRTLEAPDFLLAEGGELAERLALGAKRVVSWYRLDLGPDMLRPPKDSR